MLLSLTLLLGGGAGWWAARVNYFSGPANKVYHYTYLFQWFELIKTGGSGKEVIKNV